MNVTSVVKTVIAPIVSIGVGAIVGNVIKATTPADVKILSKICIGVGGLALSGIVSSKIVDSTKEEIDDTAKQLKELKTALNDTKN